jgi:hypothetical protein
LWFSAGVKEMRGDFCAPECTKRCAGDAIIGVGAVDHIGGRQPHPGFAQPFCDVGLAIAIFAGHAAIVRLVVAAGKARVAVALTAELA